MTLSMVLVIGIPSWALLVVAPPRNFLRIGKVGELLFMLLATWTLFVPAILYGEVDRAVWVSVGAVCSAILIGSAVGSFFWKPASNLRVNMIRFGRHADSPRAPREPRDSA